MGEHADGSEFWFKFIELDLENLFPQEKIDFVKDWYVGFGKSLSVDAEEDGYGMCVFVYWYSGKVTGEVHDSSFFDINTSRL